MWRVFYGATATAISVMEQIWDVFKQDLEYQKNTTYSMTSAWWNDRMKNYFQYAPADPDRGVLKITDNYVYYYSIIDDTKKIIDFCSTVTNTLNRSVTIKVAKDNGSGAPTQLSNDELMAAATYVDRVQAAGAQIKVVSFPADKLLLNMNIYYDGMYVESTVQSNVQNAVVTYLQQLTFDGIIHLSKLVDVIQAVEGVNDVLLVSASAIKDGGSEEPFNRVFSTQAGYATFDADSSLITMILGE
jgi:hypothetical protein